MTIRFPALLEDSEGNIIEYGYAELASDPNSINFTGEFIPLHRIGEKIAVVRMHKNKRLEILKGTVFLSSKNLLQVTGVDDVSMDRIRAIFSSNTRLQARLNILEEKKKFRVGPPKILYQTDAIVYYISETEVKFLSMDPISRGQQLLLDLEEPFTAKGIKTAVRSAIDFENVMNAYLCDITDIPREHVKALREFIKKASETGGSGV